MPYKIVRKVWEPMVLTLEFWKEMSQILALSKIANIWLYNMSANTMAHNVPC